MSVNYQQKENNWNLVTPYGGELVNLLAENEERARLISRASTLPSIQLSHRSLCDLEMMAVGAFSPLDRFMGKADYERVLEQMRLSDGTLFPIPITLPVAPADHIRAGQEIAVRNAMFELVAVMKIEEVFEWDHQREALLVAGTTDNRHPLVSEMHSWAKLYISGPIKVVNLSKPNSFAHLRRTPAELRALLEKMGYPNVVAFQTRNPIHRAHEELTKRAAAKVDGALLLHPVVGITSPGDVDFYTRVRSYKALVEKYYDRRQTVLSLLPLAMRMAGPREALWHAIIRRNYGANYFIVGRDHAGAGMDSSGNPFYGPYDAQRLLAEHAGEIGVEMVPSAELIYLNNEDRYEEADRIPAGAESISISGSRVRGEYLANGTKLPQWFTRPEVAEILSEAYPPRHQRGFCLWFTGLSGAGKSTIAEIVSELLAERGRQVTGLDGDVVRTHLSKGLGFSKEDRDTNILRIGFVAAEIVRHRGAVICAAVSPYASTRNQVRNMIGGDSFIQIYVDTPLDVCEQRDVKGLYAKARRGEMKGFTGIDDPYEAPLNPDIVLTTTDCSPEANARLVVKYLEDKGLLLPSEENGPECGWAIDFAQEKERLGGYSEGRQR
jgi:sulfate adenylyltransferase